MNIVGSRGWNAERIERAELKEKLLFIKKRGHEGIDALRRERIRTRAQSISIF